MNSDRWFFVHLYRWFPSILPVLMIIRPGTLVRWHRAGFRRYWRWKSRRRGGRPQIDTELRVWIQRMAVLYLECERLLMADTVVKVENRVTPKMSRRPIFSNLQRRRLFRIDTTVCGHFCTKRCAHQDRRSAGARCPCKQTHRWGGVGAGKSPAAGCGCKAGLRPWSKPKLGCA
jgi:hypothetical protein